MPRNLHPAPTVNQHLLIEALAAVMGFFPSEFLNETLFTGGNTQFSQKPFCHRHEKRLPFGTDDFFVKCLPNGEVSYVFAFFEPCLAEQNGQNLVFNFSYPVAAGSSGSKKNSKSAIVNSRRRIKPWRGEISLRNACPMWMQPKATFPAPQCRAC